eukprot:CAMPEP_0204292144 /NCGR_PEP_ID=MMETSP0468-20130131/63787_1 /ASSEMBLY_ACC=CAM_ASM_000383 /TAXON_ID=2969 /ORGANISM="Oxyrrhis marina" /LENGTH=32 /DNA_ID= /DNA_START= /DNA_END= /DNA_ORIENTATION=
MTKWKQGEEPIVMRADLTRALSVGLHPQIDRL